MKSQKSKLLQDQASVQSSLAIAQSLEEPNMARIYELTSQSAQITRDINILDEKIKRYERARIDSPDGAWVLA